MLIQLCKRCSAVASISARRVRGIVPNLYKTWSIRYWIVFYYVSDKSLISSAPVVRFAIVFSSYVEDELCDLSAVIVDAPVIPFVVRITEMTMGSSGASSWRKAEHQIRPVVFIFLESVYWTKTQRPDGIGVSLDTRFLSSAGENCISILIWLRNWFWTIPLTGPSRLNVLQVGGNQLKLGLMKAALSWNMTRPVLTAQQVNRDVPAK